MIHPDVKFEHIDIEQARRFVDISKIAQPNPRTLYVLHEKGRVVKAWDSRKGRVLLKEILEPSRELAETLRKAHGVDEVQLIDREGLMGYYREALDLKKAEELTGYEFKERAQALKDTQGNGFLIHPPREAYDYYHYFERSRRFVKEKLEPDCSFLVGVHEGKDWWTSLYADLAHGSIVRLSTFEPFPPGKLANASMPATHQELVRLAAQKSGKNAYGLFLDRPAFEGFAKAQWRGLGSTPLLKVKP
ncbi:MAG TPA: hypothetical protein VHE12_08295 [bacterium]|nr:hypothetical protein [bacterium]